jgi:predicted nucleic-acid-binding protein
MLAVDTNVLVRLLTRDDAAEVSAAESFISKGAWISHLVLAETLWVLQDADVVTAALGHYRQRPAVDFSDCLVLEIARKAGHLPVATFDRNFAKLDDVRRLA